jgi:CRISPR-associated protein Cas2
MGHHLEWQAVVNDLGFCRTEAMPTNREVAVRSTYLVCYDICNDKRLRQVFKTMRDFGDHLQYSVFECQFTPIDLARCRHVLSEIIKHNEDQVLFIDLGPSEGRGERVITALGIPYTSLDAPCIVV